MFEMTFAWKQNSWRLHPSLRTRPLRLRSPNWSFNKHMQI